jgi:hypothetical protein
MKSLEEWLPPASLTFNGADTETGLQAAQVIILIVGLRTLLPLID